MSRTGAVALVLLAAACSAAPPTAAPETSTSLTATTVTSPETTTTTTATEPSPFARPAWLGTRVLETDPETGFGIVPATPPDLVDRRFQAPDILPPPTTTEFTSTVVDVPDDVLARSTWTSACPVARSELRYLTVSFWGFDGAVHTGELLVNADAVEPIVDGFRVLFDQRFPIEEMRIVRTEELDLPPTGDGNNTTSFVCRPSVGSTSWSQHAYGLAVDVNPFHNPYVKGDVVLPELASAYVDRSNIRPGMLLAGSVEASAFAAAGWGWGGNWRSAKDPMHFSANGR